jgi:type I restriction enzyme M protein
MRAAAVKHASPTSISRTGRIHQLAERYATLFPQLTDEVATLASWVEGHLARMGFKP